MVADLVRLDPAAFRRTPWKNGGGTTVDIADAYRPGAEPGGWIGMIWRLGRTRIEVPAPFSDLSGNDRILTVIGGRGLLLHTDDGRVIDAREPFVPVRFPGEWRIRSELENGPVEVLNLMADRQATDTDMRVLDPTTPQVLEAAEFVLYAPGDGATIRLDEAPVEIAAGAALRFRSETALHLAAERGRVLVAIIRPSAPPGSDADAVNR